MLPFKLTQSGTIFIHSWLINFCLAQQLFHIRLVITMATSEGQTSIYGCQTTRVEQRWYVNDHTFPPFKNTYLVIWGIRPQSHWPGPHKDSFSYTPGWWQWTCPGWRSAADGLSWTADCSYKQWCWTRQEVKLEPHSYKKFPWHTPWLLLKTSRQLTFKIT